jgi:protein-S-isoprenylcysteine O-methyltransferase Ste14
MTDADIARSRALPDHPSIPVFPPVIAFSTLAVSLLLQWLAPLGGIAQLGLGWRIDGGAILIAAGLLMTIAGRRTLMRAGTNVDPRRPSTVLVTKGIFQWTRNPLYVGILIAQLGVAVLFAVDWLVLLILPSWGILHFAVVRYEENYLERKFGDAYRRYKADVPRYLLGF